MQNNDKKYWPKSSEALMKEILSFGPEENENLSPEDQNAQFSERVKRIVKKLKDLSRRIDNLSSQF